MTRRLVVSRAAERWNTAHFEEYVDGRWAIATVPLCHEELDCLLSDARDVEASPGDYAWLKQRWTERKGRHTLPFTGEPWPAEEQAAA